MATACVYVNGFGVALPNDPVTNDDIDQVLGAVDGCSPRVKRRILMNNGIQQRYYAIDRVTGGITHTNAQLTAEAVRNLGLTMGHSLADVSCLACGTSSADQLIPSHASMVQAELGCGPCDLASMSGVCCSGMAAWKYAYLHVHSGCGANAIATGSDLASRSLRASRFAAQLQCQSSQATDEEIRAKPALAFRNEFLRWMLSDGAGAVLISSRPREDQLNLRIDWLDLFSYAHEAEPCMYAGMVKNDDGTIRQFLSVNDPDEFFGAGLLNLSQDVDILQHCLPVLMSRAIDRVRKRRQIFADQIDWLVPHYSSEWFRKPLYQGMAELNLEIPWERWFSNLRTKGNTGAASIYILLDELCSSGRVHKGDRILGIVPESARMTFGFLHLTAV